MEAQLGVVYPQHSSAGIAYLSAKFSPMLSEENSLCDASSPLGMKKFFTLSGDEG